MVTKKKGLHLGLLLSFIGVGNVIQAYKITVENNTPYKVRFGVYYHGKTLYSCRTDKAGLAPGKSEKFQSGGCTIRKVTADVYEPGSEVTGGETRRVKAIGYSAPAGRAGNTKFLIKGPTNIEGKFVYTVTRKKYHGTN